VPDVGYELANEDGEIVATAELGWPQIKVGLLRDEEFQYTGQFIAAGWRTFPVAEVLADPESYIPCSLIEGMVQYENS